MPKPFGLSAGETPGSDVARYNIHFHAVPKPHPELKHYSGSWEPDNGLVFVRAESDAFRDERGHQVRQLYDRLKKQLLSVYGPASIVETLDRGSLWQGDDEFLRSIIEDDRVHGAIWSEADGSHLDAGIKKIILSIYAEDSETARVSLNYHFMETARTGPGEQVGLSSL